MKSFALLFWHISESPMASSIIAYFPVLSSILRQEEKFRQKQL